MKREDWPLIAELMITISVLETIEEASGGSTKLSELIIAITKDLKNLIKEEDIEE